MAKAGEKSTCVMCGKPIYFNGKIWDHIGESMRHPATPTPKPKDKKA